MTGVFITAEAAFWGLLAWLVWAGSPLPWFNWIPAGIFALAGLLGPRRPSLPAGSLETGHGLLLAGLFWVVAGQPVVSRIMALDTAGLLAATGLCVGGLFYLFDDQRQKRPASRLRRDLIWTGVTLTVASLLMVGLIRGALALRSNQPIAPGRLDFMFVLVFWLSVWAGLDGHFRRNRGTGWLRNHSHGLGFVICLLLLVGQSL